MLTFPIPMRSRLISAYAEFPSGVNPAGHQVILQTTRTLIEQLLPNTVYLLDTFSATGSFPETDFLKCIDAAHRFVLPSLTIFKSRGDGPIHEGVIPITGFFHDRQIASFVSAKNSGIALQAQMQGEFSFAAGVTPFATEFFMNFSIYAIDQKEFNEFYQGAKNRR